LVRFVIRTTKEIINEIVKRTEKEKNIERGTFTLIHLLHTHGGEKKNAKRESYFFFVLVYTQTHIHRFVLICIFFLFSCEHT